MTRISDFKSDYIFSVFNTTLKTLASIFIGYIIQVILMAIIIVPVVVLALGLNFDALSNFSDSNILRSPDAASEIIQNMMTSFLNPKSLFTLFILIIAIAIISSWFYNFCYLVIHRYTKDNEINFGNSFSESLSKKILKSFVLTIILFVLFAIVYLMVAILLFACISIHFSIAVIVGLIAFVFILSLFIRTSIAYPILIISDRNILDSISDSFDAIDFQTSLKYSLFTILGSIVLGILGVIALAIIGFIISYLGIVGEIIDAILQIFISTLTTGFTVSLILGLFYNHYYKEESKELDLEENLIV